MFSKKIILLITSFLFASNVLAQSPITQSNTLSGFSESTVAPEQENIVEFESENLIVLLSGIRNLYNYNPQSKNDYSSIKPSILLLARVVPEGMRDRDKLKSRFGSVSISATKINNTSFNNAFNIIYQNIDSKSCTDIVNNTASSFYKVTIGNIVVKDLNTNTKNLDNNILFKECYSQKDNKVTFTSL